MAFTPDFIDSFDTSTDPLRWGLVPSVAIQSGGRGGSWCLRTGTGTTGSGAVQSPTLNAAVTRTVGFGLQLNGGTTSQKNLAMLRNGTTTQVDIRAQAVGGGNTSNAITVTRNGTLLGTAATQLAPYVWHHVCLKVSVADAGGRVILLLNGVEELNFTADTRNGTPTTIDNVYLSGFGSTLYDDFYIGTSDDTSASLTDMPGDVRVIDVKPTGPGDSTDFTPYPTAPNWSKTNERLADDLGYVTSSTPGHKDLYAIGHSSTITDVYAVAPYMVARKSDVGPRTARVMTKSGATEVQGSVAGLTAGYTHYSSHLPVNPDTGLAWTPAALSALQVGVKVEA